MIDFKTIKNGDTFWEEDIQYRAKEDCQVRILDLTSEKRNQFYFTGVVVNREYPKHVEFVTTQGFEYYGPKLYKEQQYFSYKEIEESINKEERERKSKR